MQLLKGEARVSLGLLLEYKQQDPLSRLRVMHHQADHMDSEKP